MSVSDLPSSEEEFKGRVFAEVQIVRDNSTIWAEYCGVMKVRSVGQKNFWKSPDSLGPRLEDDLRRH